MTTFEPINQNNWKISKKEVDVRKSI
jgi:hypothetical protein